MRGRLPAVAARLQLAVVVARRQYDLGELFELARAPKRTKARAIERQPPGRERRRGHSGPQDDLRFTGPAARSRGRWRRRLGGWAHCRLQLAVVVLELPGHLRQPGHAPRRFRACTNAVTATTHAITAERSARIWSAASTRHRSLHLALCTSAPCTLGTLTLRLYCPPMSLRRKTILVVDPDEAGREALVAPLSRDYRVLRAAAGGAGGRGPDEGGSRRRHHRDRAARHDRRRAAAADASQFPAHGSDPDLVGRRASTRRSRRSSSAPITSWPSRSPPDGAALHRRARRGAGRAQPPGAVVWKTRSRDGGQREFVAGPSPALRDLLETAQKVARTDATVLILGRERHRQGAAGAARPSRLGACRRPVHRRQHGGDPAGPGREPPVRSREGIVHRRRAAAHRQVRAGERRHAVPRRNRRPAARPAGQAAARHPGARDRAGRRRPADPHLVPRSSRRPTSTSSRRSSSGPSAPISTTGSTSSR